MKTILMRRVHFIGIGGSGLSAIAQVLLESGVIVTGSDRQSSQQALRLEGAGARVFIGHHPEHVKGADLVVRSSAIPDDNIEVLAALGAGIPVLKRADFLAEWFSSPWMTGRNLIAVAGTHGKTTTTAMVAWMLAALGYDPSFIIGGVSTNLSSNAHAGRGPFFVIEADEYDRMFLGLNPQIAIVTNVEHDHPDCYPSPQIYFQAFQDFANRLVPGGTLLGCGDNPGAARLLAEMEDKGLYCFTYGLSNSNYTYQAQNLHQNIRGGFTFDLICNLRLSTSNLEALPVSLRVPGEHNVRNALAALAVADQLGLALGQAAHALGAYQGTGRRFEIRGEVGGVTLIDDYAHHPSEIQATLAAARARFPNRAIWAVWQPHTYSRTRSLLPDFAGAFGDADHVLVTEIYAAREAAPLDGFSAIRVVHAMSHPDVGFVPGLDQVRDELLARLAPGDVVLVLSAGDADQINGQVLEALKERRLENA